MPALPVSRTPGVSSAAPALFCVALAKTFLIAATEIRRIRCGHYHARFSSVPGPPEDWIAGAVIQLLEKV
jgi:hypothetical protein